MSQAPKDLLDSQDLLEREVVQDLQDRLGHQDHLANRVIEVNQAIKEVEANLDQGVQMEDPAKEVLVAQQDHVDQLENLDRLDLLDHLGQLEKLEKEEHPELEVRTHLPI